MQKILILLLAAALLLATCGCTENAPPAAPPAPEPVTMAPSPPPSPPTATPLVTTKASVNANTIMITRVGFDPETLTVKRGATVRWVNTDSTDDPALYNPTHRIKIQNVYTGQTISPGQGWSWVFTDPGTFDYQDLVHPELRGTVQVVM